MIQLRPNLMANSVDPSRFYTLCFLHEAAREPRQIRTGYRCFLSDLAGLAGRKSAAPDGRVA